VNIEGTACGLLTDQQVQNNMLLFFEGGTKKKGDNFIMYEYIQNYFFNICNSYQDNLRGL
jgi:hypothetical protein